MTGSDRPRIVPAPRPSRRDGVLLQWYLPDGVVPERGPDGRPTLLVAGSGSGGFLQLGVRLGPDDAAVEAVRRTLVAADPTAALGPAPVAVDAVEVVLTVGDREPAVVTRTVPNPVYPCAAAISVPLDAAEHRAVVAAVRGRLGVLTVRYVGLRWEPWLAAGGPATSTFGFSSTTSTSTSTSSTTSTTRTGGQQSPRVTSSTAWTGCGATGPVQSPADPPPDDPLPDLPPTLTTDVAGWFAGDGDRHVVGSRPT